MFHYTIRRLLLAIPTLLFISLILFLLLDLAPGDPTAQLPLTIPPEVKEKIRISLGLGEPIYVRYLLWLQQFFVNEPLHLLAKITGIDLSGGAQRVISWQTRSPGGRHRRPEDAPDALGRRPFLRRRRADSRADRSRLRVPAVQLVRPARHVRFDGRVLGADVLHRRAADRDILGPSGLVPLDLRHDARGRGLAELPVPDQAARDAGRGARPLQRGADQPLHAPSMLDNLNQDYVRTARAKGVAERAVLLVHVLRNSMIPVVTVIALGVPTVFGGAIITEQVFKVNGLGQLLITAIQANDIPMVQTLTFIFAILIVLFNLAADILYGISIRGYAMTDPAASRPGRPPARSGATSGTSSRPIGARWPARYSSRSCCWRSFWARRFWPIDAQYIDIRARNSGPSLAHPLGTDQLGRDTLARVFAGGRASIAVGMTAMLLSLVLGTLIGVIAGFFRRIDGPLMRLTDLFLACRCCRSCWSSSCCSATRCGPRSARRPGSSFWSYS